MSLPVYLPHRQIQVNRAGQIYIGKSFEEMDVEVWIDGYMITSAPVTSARVSVGREYTEKRADVYFLRESETHK